VTWAGSLEALSATSLESISATSLEPSAVLCDAGMPRVVSRKRASEFPRRAALQ
jgi:hypothetical protein